MPRSGERYPHQQDQHQQGRDGYDEDWDDDVYYAAASGPDSGAIGRATGREKQFGGGSGLGREDLRQSDEASKTGRSVRERTPAKRHYMKVPNMRQLRPMRPTGDSSVTGGAPRLGERNESPRASTETELGDTATSSSGEGSSFPLLEQMTPPSLPQKEWELGSVGRASEREASPQGTTPSIPCAAPPADASFFLGHGVEQAAAHRPGNGCLVRLRGSPRSTRALRQEKPTSPLSGFPTVMKGMPSFGGHGQRTTQSSPASAAAASVDLSFTGGKRKRAGLAGSQRFGAVAWPKLRGEESPPPKNSRRTPDGGVHRPGDGSNEAGRSIRHGGLNRDREEGAEGVAASASAPWHFGTGGIRRKRDGGQQQQYDQGGEPPSSSGSSSSYSSTPRGAGNVSSSGRSREGLSSDDRGGHGPGQVDGRAGSVRGPFLTDRPARWVAKGRASSVRSPLRSFGATSPSRGAGSNASNASRKAPSSTAKPSSAPSFPGRVRTRGAPRARGAEDDEGHTFKLTSVFQATANLSSRPRSAWGKDNHPGGRRRRSQYPPVRGGHSDTSTNDTPSFDPTRIGATAGGVIKAEEVEEVGSDEDEDGFVDNVDVTHWNAAGEGWGGGDDRGRAPLTSDVVDDYDDQLLGEEGNGDTARDQGEGAHSGVGEGDTSSVTRAAGDAGVSPGGGDIAEALPREDSPAAIGVNERDGGGDRGEVVEAVNTATDLDKGDRASSVTSGDQGQRRAEQPASSTAVLSEPLLEGKVVVAAATALEPPRGEQPPQQQQHQQQHGQQDTPKEPSPPPRTPVRPRTFSASSFLRGPLSSAASAASSGRGKWRPSFGSGGDGGVVRSPGVMQAPWAAFSTPLGGGGAGRVAPPSGSLTAGSASTRRRRGGGAGNGRLGRLLQQVRARFEGDEARLLSGEFPFHQAFTPTGNGVSDGKRGSGGGVGGGGGGVSRRDHGDPRTRCRVALDVTVLPVASRPAVAGFDIGLEGGGNGDHGRGSCGLEQVLCFVHRVVDVSSGSTSSEGRLAHAAGISTILKSFRPLEGVSVDALFKQDTRRALDVCPGSQLRVYDPCCVWRAEERREALLICTQLCEPFPACLPALPAPEMSSLSHSRLDDGGDLVNAATA